MNILITGGTGFIGKACVKFFKTQNHDITILTRDLTNVPESAKGIGNLDEINDNENIDAIINLAGSPIDKRWTKNYKNELLESRLNTTKEVISLIERLQNKPKVLISASAVGYYGSQDDKELNESSPHLPKQNEFTHELCKLWEEEALKAKELGVRVCIARIGPVIGKSGGMMKKVLPAFKGGLGKRLGSGEQYLSWIHLYDVVSSFNFMIAKNKCSGIYNVTAPKPITNGEFTRTINETLNLPTFLFVPEIVIKIAYGEMGETLLLNGQNAIPKKLIDEGFKFKFNTFEEAIHQIVNKKKVA